MLDLVQQECLLDTKSMALKNTFSKTKKLKTVMKKKCDPATPLLGIYLEKIII